MCHSIHLCKSLCLYAYVHRPGNFVTHRKKDKTDVRIDSEACSEGAHPLNGALSRRRLDAIQLVYKPNKQPAPLTNLSQYASRPGRRAHFYAWLAVSSLTMGETTAVTHCNDPWRDGQAEWAYIYILGSGATLDESQVAQKSQTRERRMQELNLHVISHFTNCLQHIQLLDTHLTRVAIHISACRFTHNRWTA